MSGKEASPKKDRGEEGGKKRQRKPHEEARLKTKGRGRRQEEEKKRMEADQKKMRDAQVTTINGPVVVPLKKAART